MLEQHQKAVVQGKIEKSGMVDHIWKEKRKHVTLWNYREEDRRVRHLKEAADMLGYTDLLSRPSIEMNMMWEPIILKG